MSFSNIFNVAATGLSAQRIRINVISSNLANANTTRTEDGGPYKRKDVVFEQIMKGELNGGVRVNEIKEDEKPPMLKFDPSHPDANEEGYVMMPNIHPVEEMVNMLEASRSYEANVTVLSTAKQLALKAIDIGRA